MGCSWVSARDRNSVGTIAEKRGFSLIDHTDAATDLFRDGQRAGFARLQRRPFFGLNRNRLDEHLAHSGEPIAVDPASGNQPAEKAGNGKEMGNANHNDELENGVHGVTSCCKADSCPR